MRMMTDVFRTAPRLGAVLGIASLWLVCSGCGDSNKSDLPLFPAQGKVTLGGKPLGDADLQFIPAGQTPGQGGYGKTNADGLYEIKTRFGETGVPAGEYKVVVSKAKGKGAANPVNPDKPIPSAVDDEELSPTYTDPLATVLKATVAAGGEAMHDFDLKPGKRKREAVSAARVAVPVPPPK
ncbi:MAG: hypothetical protein P4L84_22245 [Isosphaeraceae bacterium]|nr:hypothetical protein [Isosphaeraceae bacterium]